MTRPDEQLALALGPFRNQRLFSDHFLTDVLPTWDEFQQMDPGALFDELRDLWEGEQGGLQHANEAQTEERWIQPILQTLGFAYTVQAGLRVGLGRRQPDYALFLSDEDRSAADGLEGASRYQHAVAVADAKKFDRPLERRSAAGALSEDPVAQIINYVSITRRAWGILTNGRLWRLYSAQADLVTGACYEVDLVALLQGGDPDAFRYFAAFFSASAFGAGPDGRSFLDRAVAESKANAVRVGATLERQIFSAVPLIAEGLIAGEERTPEVLAAAFDNSLVFLYRLLFCLYAEARGLLPVENPHYRAYSLRDQKEELARDRGRGRVFSSASDDLYNDLRALFRIVSGGDPALGVAEYNGTLFSASRHPYFTDRSIPDNLLAPALDYLYRVGGEFVDYWDLSVRHLGTIYERLLDYRLEDREGLLVLAPASGRHETGSYFTPEHIVDLIVERTLEPLLERRSTEIAQAGHRGDAALESFLDLRVLDPAMGSGHFLVSAAGYISQYIATDPSYDGDLPLAEIQRLVAERCLYGVDANPMAVQLAQLALWLTTAQKDEPLTFLNNLRPGNSLVGVELAELLMGGGTVFAERLSRDAEAILGRIEEIEQRASQSGDDVHEKERLADAIQELREPLEEYADQELAPSFTNGIGRFFHWELEFPEVFLDSAGRPRPDGGFDAVVGNPPYVRIQELGRELANYCRERYLTATGNFDVYIPFVERSLSLLRLDGRLGFIVPNKLLKLDYARRLRERLSASAVVDEIVDFGDAQIFEGATNYTCVLVLDRDGQDGFDYRRVRGDSQRVRRTIVNVDAMPVEHFATRPLGQAPWILAAGDEAKLLRAMRDDGAPLSEVTAGIFTGLQTSADRVYIVEDRGQRGANRLIYSRASDAEIEIEPDLLHPLASGADVDRYAFRHLKNLLLFPYRRQEGQMNLLQPDELARLPLTQGYLRLHEDTLRGRERGRMDHEAWYAYVYPKSLGAHDSPKLGVPRLCERLRASADPGGTVYLDNVDVNGILPKTDGGSIWMLLVLLNSRLLDWVFHLHSVPFRGNFMSANKQFIAPLPIRIPQGAEGRQFDELGERLHRASRDLATERGGFIRWLESLVGAHAESLRGSTAISAYDERSADDLLRVLRANHSRLRLDPGSRAFQEQFEREYGASMERVRAFRSQISTDEAAADELVFELYELTAAQRELVNADSR